MIARHVGQGPVTPARLAETVSAILQAGQLKVIVSLAIQVTQDLRKTSKAVNTTEK